MRTHGNGMDLEGQSSGIGFGVEVAGLLRLINGPGDDVNPLVHDGRDAVAYDPAPAVELEGSSAEEASSPEDALLDHSQPVLKQAPQSWHTLGRGDGPPCYFLDEYLSSRFDGR